MSNDQLESWESPEYAAAWAGEDVIADMLELPRHLSVAIVADAERLGEVDVDPAQVVVSSRALHHFSPDSLRGVYRAAFDIVEPGGFVMNLDHVGAKADWEEVARRVRKQFTGDRKKARKPHRQDYPLARADEHAAWMEEAGFGPADTPWRMFYTALIVARRPA